MSIQSLRQLILCATPLSGQHTVREHLISMSCSNLTSSAFIPYDSIVIMREDNNLEVNFENNERSINITTDNIDISINDTEYSVDIIKEERIVNNECN